MAMERAAVNAGVRGGTAVGTAVVGVVAASVEAKAVEAVGAGGPHTAVSVEAAAAGAVGAAAAAAAAAASPARLWAAESEHGTGRSECQLVCAGKAETTQRRRSMARCCRGYRGGGGARARGREGRGRGGGEGASRGKGHGWQCWASYPSARCGGCTTIASAAMHVPSSSKTSAPTKMGVRYRSMHATSGCSRKCTPDLGGPSRPAPPTVVAYRRDAAFVRPAASLRPGFPWVAAARGARAVRASTSESLELPSSSSSSSSARRTAPRRPEPAAAAAGA